MRVDVSSYSSNFIQLVLSNSSQQFANLIRRYLTRKVKTIQILGIPNSTLNTFNILEHNLDYSTDVIQAQIQNIPLNFSPQQILNFKQEDYVFKIDAFNDTVHNLMITTQDIQIFNKDNQRYSFDFIRSVFPANPDFIPLFILRPQQLFKFEAYAVLSDSSTHSVFNHLSNISVTPCVDNNLASQYLNQILANTPQSDITQVTTDFNTTQRFRCFLTDQFDQPFNYDISFHTISSLTPKFAIYSACSQATTDIMDLSNSLHISQVKQDPNCFSFPIHHEISIGFFLQYILALDLYRVFDKNDFIQSQSFSNLHSDSINKSNFFDPSKQFCIEYASFNYNQHLFFFRYNSHSNLSLDLIQNQIKFYLSRIILQLNKFQTHFDSPS